jgi:hypothetical protein
LKGNPKDVPRMYNSALTTMSPSYTRTSDDKSPRYYYEAIQMKVMEAATYSFRSNSTMDTYGYIYKDSFNSCDPALNLISEDDQSGGSNQFQLISSLRANTTYILVVTTFRKSITGNFSILVSGPNDVTLNYISEYIYGSLNNQDRSTKIQKMLAPSVSTLIHIIKRHNTRKFANDV